MARLRKYVQPARYKVLAFIGHTESVEDEVDGINRPQFKTDFSLYIAPYDIEKIQQMVITGPNQQDDLVYANKRLGKIKRNMIIRLLDENSEDNQYTVSDVSEAIEPWDPRAYDLITLSRGNGVESGYRNV